MRSGLIKIGAVIPTNSNQHSKPNGDRKYIIWSQARVELSHHQEHHTVLNVMLSQTIWLGQGVSEVSRMFKAKLSPRAERCRPRFPIQVFFYDNGASGGKIWREQIST